MLLGFIILALPIIAILSLLIYLPYYIYTKKHDGKKTFLFHLIKYTLIGCIISVLFLTLFWGGIELSAPSLERVNLIPFVWINKTYVMGERRMIEQLFINVVMFIPYGFLLPLAIDKLRKWWRTLLIVFGTTFMIEILQLFAGRSTDIDDLIMNFLGGVIGYAFFMLVDHFSSNWQQG